MADKTAVIVGTGSGLGASMARRFAGEGFNLALCARNPGRLDPLVRELEDRGVRARAYGVDASEEGEMTDFFADAEQSLGPIALAVHNVNGRTVKNLLDLSAADMEHSWRTICLGGFLTGREAARHMTPRGAGSIVFIGGRGARRGIAKFHAFASAKAGLRSLAECMARELAPKGIHVAHFAVEASLGSERLRQANPEQATNDGFVDTDVLAELIVQTHAQPRNCWTFEADFRPWSEPFI